MSEMSKLSKKKFNIVFIWFIDNIFNNFYFNLFFEKGDE